MAAVFVLLYSGGAGRYYVKYPGSRTGKTGKTIDWVGSDYNEVESVEEKQDKENRDGRISISAGNYGWKKTYEG